MKFADKQKSRQSMCRREMNREKREIKLMHEKSLINNFTSNQECINMYNKMRSDDFNLENLCTSEKKVYETCKKFVMYNDYKSLNEIEEEMYDLRDALDNEEEPQQYYELRTKYNALKKEHKEFRNMLTSTEDGRKLFGLCKGIDSLKKYE